MYSSVEEIINGDVLDEKKDGIQYHFSEFKTNWYLTIFYKIETINGIKRIIFQFITAPGYVDDGFNAFIHYFEFEKCFEYLNREKYAALIISKGDAELEWLIDENYDYGQIDIKLTDFLKHNIYENFLKISDKYRNTRSISCEKAFYQNDYMLFNKGKGRKEQSILELTQDIEDGYYFCNAITDKYDYDNEITHRIKYKDDRIEELENEYLLINNI